MKTTEMIAFLVDSLKNNGDLDIKLFSPEHGRFDKVDKMYQHKDKNDNVEFVAPCNKDDYECLVKENAKESQKQIGAKFQAVSISLNPLLPHQIAESFIGMASTPTTWRAIDFFLSSIDIELKNRGLLHIRPEDMDDCNREWFLSYQKALAVLFHLR